MFGWRVRVGTCGCFLTAFCQKWMTWQWAGELQQFERSQKQCRCFFLCYAFLLTVLSLWLRLLPVVVLPAGLDPETLAVLWTMVDRQEPESPHAPFWAALPPHLCTGGADNGLSKTPAATGVCEHRPAAVHCLSIDETDSRKCTICLVRAVQGCLPLKRWWTC